MNPAVYLQLTEGVTETEQYTAWKFPGGEIHLKLKPEFMRELTDSPDGSDCLVVARLNNSDDFMLFAIAVDTIAKTWDNNIHAYFPYMAYQQADRDFGEGESFSLKTITRLLEALPVHSFQMFDPHSDVAEALLPNGSRQDNSGFIESVLYMIGMKYGQGTDGYSINNQLAILSPDAGAYKKIFKLAEKIRFKGSIETANKYRDIKDGALQVRLSQEDFGGKDILIIDDICVGGRTFTALADELKRKNAGRLFLAVSHGIFSNGLLELGRYFSDIFTTNSRRDSYEDMIKEVQDRQQEATPEYGGLFQLHVFEVI